MRLIDADALEPHEQFEPMGNGEYEYVEVVYKNDIDNVPTIEAEPIVRCKDCCWWDDMYGNGVKGYCHACKHGYYSPTWEISIQRTTDPDFYCGDGERKEP